MQHDRVVAVLVRVRRRLNLVRIAALGSRWGAVAGLAAAAVMAVLALAGVVPARTGALAALSAAGLGFVAGTVRAFTRRLTTRDAAAWVDRGLGDEGLFSAGLTCAERLYSNFPGPYDGILADKAADAADAAAALRAPRRYAAAPAGLLALALAAGAVVAALPVIRPTPTRAAVAPDAAYGRELSPEAAPADAPMAVADDEPTPEELAEFLFPDQPELARLLAEALRTGRLDDAKKLLEKSEIARTQLEEKKTSGTGAPGAPGSRERMERAVRELGGDGGSSSETERGQEGGSPSERVMSDDRLDAAPMEAPDDAPVGDKEGGTPADGEGTGGRSGGTPGEGEGGTGGDGSGASDPEAGGAKRGNEAGTGSGMARDWGAIDPLASGGKADIPPLEGGAFFEMILPEDDPGGTPLDRVRAAAAALEEALARESLPADYAEAVRHYFLDLGKETFGSATP